jgi:phage host-nuclease inhibitor protein Gam
MNIREQIIADITAKVETKLSSQKVELALKQVSDFQKEADALYSEMTSKGEQFKKEYYSKTASLVKPFNQLRSELYNNSQDFLSKTKELGIDGKSATPYKQMEKLIQDMDKRNEFFNKEYVKN